MLGNHLDLHAHVDEFFNVWPCVGNNAHAQASHTDQVDLVIRSQKPISYLIKLSQTC